MDRGGGKTQVEIVGRPEGAGTGGCGGVDPGRWSGAAGGERQRET